MTDILNKQMRITDNPFFAFIRENINTLYSDNILLKITKSGSFMSSSQIITKEVTDEDQKSHIVFAIIYSCLQEETIPYDKKEKIYTRSDNMINLLKLIYNYMENVDISRMNRVKQYMGTSYVMGNNDPNITEFKTNIEANNLDEIKDNIKKNIQSIPAINLKGKGGKGAQKKRRRKTKKRNARKSQRKSKKGKRKRKLRR